MEKTPINLDDPTYIELMELANEYPAYFEEIEFKYPSFSLYVPYPVQWQCLLELPFPFKRRALRPDCFESAAVAQWQKGDHEMAMVWVWESWHQKIEGVEVV